MDTAVKTGADIQWQRFSVPYDYPVAFTRGLFDVDNPLLIDMLALASCKHVVGGASNVLYAALWYTPELEFSFPPILATLNSG